MEHKGCPGWPTGPHGASMLVADTHSQESTPEIVSWESSQENLMTARMKLCSQKRTRRVSTAGDSSIKRQRSSDNNQANVGSQTEDSLGESVCVLPGLESSGVTQISSPSMRATPSLQHILSNNLSLSCSESDLFSAAASNDTEDHLGSAQSPRRRSPTPAAPASVAALHFNPELLRLLQVLQASEQETTIDATYLTSRHGPKDNPTLFLEAYMRRQCASWMVEVAAEYDLSQETLHVAVACLDRFLSVTRAVPRSQLQMIGTACLLVAAKHEEESHPSVEAFVDMAANSFTPSDLVRMEALLLSCLKFRLASPTSYTFLSILRGLLDLSPDMHALAAYYTELAMLEYSMLKYTQSTIATAAVVLASGHLADTSTLQKVSRVMANVHAAVGPCIGDLQKLTGAVEAALFVPGGDAAYLPVRDKFATDAWHRAALMLERCTCGRRQTPSVSVVS